MKVIDSLKNRCGIFLFYDRDGIVDDYIIYMLKDLKNSLSYLLVVCNGKPKEEELKKLQMEADEVLIRRNHGFDVGGYREGLFYLGFRELEKYDEIVLFNYTFFGGIYPFSEMFEKMSIIDLDFWGITKHHKVEYDPYGKISYGYMPEHIQSHFLVLRNSLISSDDYKEFIISMKNPGSYVDSICDYEAVLTKYFEDLGYKWAVYVDSQRFERYAYCPIMFYIKDLLEKDRCPIIKRRSFFTDYKDFMINTCGESSIEAYEFIRQNTDYDINLIWDNILRLENMAEVQKVMQLNYCIADDVKYQEILIEDMAVAIWIKDVKDLQFYEKYLTAVTEKYQIYLYGIKENIEVVKEKLGSKVNLHMNETELYSIQEFIGRLTAQGNRNYSYYAVCIIDSVEKIRPYSNEVSNVYKDWSCILPSEEYIVNVKNTFMENPRMGMAVPPVADFGEFFAKYADGWAGEFKEVSTYLNKINVKVNIKEDIAPLVPAGGNFWIASKLLFSGKMKEALEIKVKDEVFLYALSEIVQGQGYYTGVFYSNAYAAVEITNSDYMMRELNKAVFEKYGANYHDVVLERVQNNILEEKIPDVVDDNWKARTKQKLKKVLPEKTYKKGKEIYFHLRGREFKG